MAYTHTYPHGLGLDVADLIKKGGPALQAASKVILDPALPEVTCHVLRLNKITEGKPPGPTCPRRTYSAAEKRMGIGLARAVTPIRMAVWARQNPALAFGAAAGAVGLVWLVGFTMGRSR